MKTLTVRVSGDGSPIHHKKCSYLHSTMFTQDYTFTKSEELLPSLPTILCIDTSRWITMRTSTGSNSHTRNQNQQQKQQYGYMCSPWPSRTVDKQ